MINNLQLINSLFVSRSLDESSPIKKIANKSRLHVKDDSLIDFRDLPFSLPKNRILFFYSRQGIESFVRGIHNDLSGYRAICFGDKTAAYCMNYMPVIASTNASPSYALQTIKHAATSEKVTFICGKHSLRSVHGMLDKDQYEECVVYDHQPKQGMTLGKFSVAILTSPMNVKAFFINQGSADHYIAIGPTTGRSLSEYSIDHILAREPSEEAMADTLSELLKN